MKTFSILSLTLGITLLTISCNNDAGAGHSTSVESTVDSGKAPVEYNGSVETPKTDSSMQSHPTDQAQRQNSNTASPAGAAGTSTPPMSSSNTTDSSTTSGSSTKKK